jgi:tryptophan synthase beta chain
VDDAEAMEAFRLLCRTEGIIPAIESAHALAGAIREGKRLGPGAVILVSLSGRGDKDVETASRYFGLLDAAAEATAGEPTAGELTAGEASTGGGENVTQGSGSR